MRKVVDVAKLHEADRIVAEVNNGGDYIGTLLRTVDTSIPYLAVRATRGKYTRAEPISALYEQARVHHLGSFPQLEDQLCTWAPIDPESPDRLDALIWNFTDLKDLISGSWADAYGVIKCAHCGGPFLREVDGRPRTACPHCGRPVSEAA